MSLVSLLSVSLSHMSVFCAWLQVPQAAFSLSHTVLLHKNAHCSQTSQHNLLMIQAILNWGVTVESWVTTPAMRATNMWLQNLSSLVSQLSCKAASGDYCNSYALHDLSNKFWQNMYFRLIFSNMSTRWSSWIRKKSIVYNKNNSLAEKWQFCVSGTPRNKQKNW